MSVRRLFAAVADPGDVIQADGRRCGAAINLEELRAGTTGDPNFQWKWTLIGTMIGVSEDETAGMKVEGLVHVGARGDDVLWLASPGEIEWVWWGWTKRGAMDVQAEGSAGLLKKRPKAVSSTLSPRFRMVAFDVGELLSSLTA